VKYRLQQGSTSLATPTEEDLKFFNALLLDFPKNEDALVLDQALDWYSRGRSSPHVFTKFLCYYISVESIATAIFEGKADLKFGFKKGKKADIRTEKAICIRAKLMSCTQRILKSSFGKRTSTVSIVLRRGLRLSFHESLVLTTIISGGYSRKARMGTLCMT